MAKRTSRELRLRRHGRVRKKVNGSNDRPRLSVFRSSAHIYAQVINDVEGRTLVAASSVDKALAPQLVGKTKMEDAQAVGRLVAERALSSGITKVVFDRGGFRYHGRIKALADAAREAGLSF
jgi:large subunit ribosomal protein L18